MPDLDLITSTEAGRILGCSGRTVQRRAEAGLLVPIRRLPGPNGPLLFLRADVERLAAETAEASR